MNIAKYDPFRDLRTLQDEMNRLFTGNLQRGSQDEIMRALLNPLNARRLRFAAKH